MTFTSSQRTRSRPQRLMFERVFTANTSRMMRATNTRKPRTIAMACRNQRTQCEWAEITSTNMDSKWEGGLQVGTDSRLRLINLGLSWQSNRRAPNHYCTTLKRIPPKIYRHASAAISKQRWIIWLEEFKASKITSENLNSNLQHVHKQTKPRLVKIMTFPYVWSSWWSLSATETCCQVW